MDAYADEDNCPDINGRGPEPKPNVPSDHYPDERHCAFEERKEQGWLKRLQTTEAKRNGDSKRVEAEWNDECCNPEHHR